MSSNAPLQPTVPALPPGASGRPMALLPMLWESLLLTGRYFIIVYPVFLFLILVSILIPRAVPDFSHWAWWVILLGIVAVYFIFSAGWTQMMYEAVVQWETPQASNPAQPFERAKPLQSAFSLLRAFIPGMGQYGVSFIGGGLLWIIVNLIPIGLLLWLGLDLIGIPPMVKTLLQQPTLSTADIQHLQVSLPRAQLAQLISWNWLMLAGTIILAVINGLLMFWQPFIILNNSNPIKAFGQSIRHVVRHPVQCLLIMGYLTTIRLVLTLAASLTGMLSFVGNFLLILTTVFFGLFLFLYLIRLQGTTAESQ